MDDDAPPRRAAPQGITTIEELLSCNEAELLAGYRAGLRNEADFARLDRAYWHGYFNGLVDGKHMHPTREQRELVRLYAEHLHAVSVP